MSVHYEIKNTNRSIPSLSIGKGVPHIIATVGITDDSAQISEEIKKMNTAVQYGASMIADVSTTGNISLIHRAIMDSARVPLCTVPIYEIHMEANKKGQWNARLSKNLVLDIIERQASSGVDCMTLHSAFRHNDLRNVAVSERWIKMQGRGGGMIQKFMQTTGRENPLYEYYPDILTILERHNVTLSIGSCLRNGTVDDAIDDLVAVEILAQAELMRIARQAGVNVMIEGLSHIRFGMIAPYVRWTKSICEGSPLRLLGPIGTERGLGYDHITAAICAREAVAAGADLITCVTRAEHIGLPSAEELREAVVGLRIAVELAVQDWQEQPPATNFQCGLGFNNLTPNQIFDLDRAIELKRSKNAGDILSCSMCSESCQMRLNGNAATRA